MTPEVDERPRPRFEREAVSVDQQFSLAMNISFQFWDSSQSPEDAEILWEPELWDTINQNWWFQTFEPSPPKGWRASSKWTTTRSKFGATILTRVLTHGKDHRNLDEDQLKVLGYLG